MSNLEHLVENGLYALKDWVGYDEWLKKMRKDPNWEGIEGLTIDDLWEICQYTYCRWLEGLSIFVVHCGKCKYKCLYDDGDTKYYYCALEDRPNRQWSVDDTDYCSWGEREDDES